MKKFYKPDQDAGKWVMAFILLVLSLGAALPSIAQSTEAQVKSPSQSRGAQLRHNQLPVELGPVTGYKNRVGGKTSKPRNIQAYFWQDNGWQQGGRFVRTYNAAGLLTEEILVNSFTNQNASRTTHVYNSQNEEIEYISYNWVNNAWAMVTGSRNQATYANNLVSEKIFQSYLNGLWSTERKVLYLYNEANVLKEIHYYGMRQDGSWELHTKDVLEYTSGVVKPTAITNQVNMGNGWVDMQKFTNLVWNEGSFKPLSFLTSWDLAGYTVLKWNGLGLVQNERYVTTYQGTTGFTLTQETWINNAWMGIYRVIEVYDEAGNQTLRQTFNWINNQWSTSLGIKSINTYNAEGDLTEVIKQELDLDTRSASFNTFVNQSKYVNSNFQIILAAGEEVPVHVQVYPNPTLGQLSVKVEKGAGTSVKVVNLAGQTMLSTALSAGSEHEINLADLPAATYLLQIKTKTGVRTQRIVKL